jgi:anthranilate phosphoribosyltransferase
MFNLKNSIEKLMAKQNLDHHTCQNIMGEILAGKLNSAQTAAFLVLLRSKTETPEELSGIISALQQKMVPVITHHNVLDIVGTGGDGANTVNISTGSAILAASCGIKIAKHGNRAVSSLAGSADVLEALGININQSPTQISQCIDQINIGFCFAPNFHPALYELKLLRKQLNVPTTFNIIGPLSNPANPDHYLLGVYDQALLYPIAHALQNLKTKKSFVVHGSGLDELSCIGPAKIIEVTENDIKEQILDPTLYNLEPCQRSDLQGGDANTNAQLLLSAFSNKNKAIGNTLILNAGVALYLYGLHSTLSECIAHAKQNLLDNKANLLLNLWKEFSHDTR